MQAQEFEKKEREKEREGGRKEGRLGRGGRTFA
jgi:hypothetical protein